MDMKIACPACGTKYGIDQSRAGKKLRCKCGEVFRAPAAFAPPAPPNMPDFDLNPITQPGSELPPIAGEFQAPLDESFGLPPIESASPAASVTAMPMDSPAAPPQGPPMRARSPSRFTVERYHSDGGFTASGIALLAVAAFATAVILGAVASFGGQFFYLVFLFPVLIGLGVGLASAGAVRLGHVRNITIAGVCAFVAGCLAMFTMHYFDYRQFQSTMREELDGLPPQVAAVMDRLPDMIATRAQQPAEMQRLIDQLEKEPLQLKALLVRDFFGYVDFAAHVGVSIGHGQDIGKNADRGINLGYIGTYLYWLIEVAVVAIIAFAVAVMAANNPYCAQCNSWKKPRALGSLASPPQAAIEALEQGELNRLGQCGPSSSPGTIAVSASVCPSCQESSTVDVKLEQVTKTKKGDSKKDIAHVTYPGAALPALQNLFIPMPAPQANSAPPDLPKIPI